MIPAGEKTDWRSAERSKSFWWKWPEFARSDTWNNLLLNPQWVWYKARVDGSQISHFDTTLHFDWLPVTRKRGVQSSELTFVRRFTTDAARIYVRPWEPLNAKLCVFSVRNIFTASVAPPSLALPLRPACTLTHVYSYVRSVSFSLHLMYPDTFFPLCSSVWGDRGVVAKESFITSMLRWNRLNTRMQLK